ncbi:SDR family NAD(P)-dependent oxidoreductase [Mycolicibacterium komossense]|uniref:SDR family oxidoreductase n=1 Tax=Mycolicibacterium komossense TaxID=1779 RepID=A0ABT3CL58_9MYCO|nr:SDR family oxidoreductase [Mycolicibacterium komossense]MCV7230165.1 SDR family oxidoreductase [Mycolicibacterium komossense]
MTRSALVTGAGGGIGLATATRLASDGIHVTATDVKPRPADLPRDVDYVTFDMIAGSPAELLGALPGPTLDYLVNAAGLALFDRDGSVLDTEEAVWDATLGVNLHGLRHLTAAAVPMLRAGQGRSVVNVASTAGVRGMDSPLDAYQVSKAAVVSLSRSLALQLGPEGIRVNTVCPGAILTPMIEPLYADNPGRRTDMEQRTPLRRLGTPADIANAIAFLLSDQASFITATDLIVDGGWIAQIK